MTLSVQRWALAVLASVFILVAIVSCNRRPVQQPPYTLQYSEVQSQYVQQVPQQVQQPLVDKGPSTGTWAIVGTVDGFLAGRGIADETGDVNNTTFVGKGS